MIAAIRATLLGGVAFLLPMVVLIILLERALELARRVADPIVAVLPWSMVDHMVLARTVAAVILLGICLVAGLVARTSLARRVVTVVEARVLANVPFYTVLKARARTLMELEDAPELRPVLVRLDDAWQPALESERLKDGRVVVFVPGAPDPWAGSLAVVDPSRITSLDIPVRSIERLSYGLGRGLDDVLVPGGSDVPGKASAGSP